MTGHANNRLQFIQQLYYSHISLTFIISAEHKIHQQKCVNVSFEIHISFTERWKQYGLQELR